MSEIADVGESAVPPTPVQQAAATPPVTEPPASDTTDLDTDLPEGRQTFDRSAMDSARKDAARYRHEAKEAKERVTALESRYGVFEGLDPADTDTWIGFASEFQAGNQEAVAQDFLRIANSILEDPNATPKEKAEAAEVADQVEQMSPDNVKTMMNEVFDTRDAAAKEQSAIADVHRELAAAGFEQGSFEARQMLFLATQHPDSDGTVQWAIEHAKTSKDADGQKTIDSFVADASNNPTPAPVDGSAPGAAPADYSNLEDGFAGAKEFMKQRQEARKEAM